MNKQQHDEVEEFINDTPRWHKSFHGSLKTDLPCIYCGITPDKLLSLSKTLTTQRKTITAELEKKHREEIIGMVIHNCYGYIDKDGEKIWQLDLKSLENDLSTIN